MYLSASLYPVQYLINLPKNFIQKLNINFSERETILQENTILKKDNFEGAKYVCSPPPRDPENQKYVWNGIQNGTFDILSSDHAPFNFKGDKGKMIKGNKTPFSISAGSSEGLPSGPRPVP